MYQEIFILLLFLAIYTLIYKFKSKISNFFHLVDFPNSKRKIHSEPTPLLGGLFIFILIGLYLYQYNSQIPAREFVSLFSLIIFFFIVGLIDDVFNLNSYFRLIILSLATFFSLSNSNFFLISDLRLINVDHIYFLDQTYIIINSKIAALFLTTLCIMLLVNALNLADGINGLSAMMITSWLLYIKIFLFNDFSPLGTSGFIILILISFYIYKGKFFMGDYGVTVGGLFVGLTAIAAYNFQDINSNTIFVEELCLLFIVPGIDMFRLFTERLIKRKDPFSADNNHLHHILLKKFSLNKTLIIYFLISFFPILIFKFFNVNALIIIALYLIVFFSILSTKLKNIFN